jgi:hypothetical protein
LLHNQAVALGVRQATVVADASVVVVLAIAVAVDALDPVGAIHAVEAIDTSLAVHFAFAALRTFGEFPRVRLTTPDSFGIHITATLFARPRFIVLASVELACLGLPALICFTTILIAALRLARPSFVVAALGKLARSRIRLTAVDCLPMGLVATTLLAAALLTRLIRALFLIAATLRIIGVMRPTIGLALLAFLPLLDAFLARFMPLLLLGATDFLLVVLLALMVLGLVTRRDGRRDRERHRPRQCGMQ